MNEIPSPYIAYLRISNALPVNLDIENDQINGAINKIKIIIGVFKIGPFSDSVLGV